MPVDENPIDPEHTYTLVTSETGLNDDGYRYGEPKELECDHCDARMIITADPTPGLWTVSHEPNCPNGEGVEDIA